MECLLSFLLLLLLPSASALDANYNRTIIAPPSVPALFAFGDSIVDSGNNDAIVTLTKCNFPPYGQDFADKRPTGRFSNGRIPPDFIGI